jgi:16S rRNA (adenine1518-N6/adenine1519-N6)-dimethyltransferase
MPSYKRLTLRPDKRLGQHFLIDQDIVNRIISLSGFDASDVVLEIGPGLGALTIPLSRTVKHIVAVEKDRRLIPLLKDRLSKAGIDNVTLVNQDILSWNFPDALDSVSSSSRLKVIGNLPYNITSPLLEKIIEQRDIIDRAVVMMQKEVAERLTALPGTKAYGALTLVVKYYAKASCLLDVQNTAFNPRPKVGSTVISLDFSSPYHVGNVQAKDFVRMVKGAFAHKRKTLINSLRNACPDIDSQLFSVIMERCNIDHKTRAEALGMNAFLCLISAYSNYLRAMVKGQ